MSDEQKINLWNEVLESIKISVSTGIFSTWFRGTFLNKIDNIGGRYIAEVGCTSSYIKSTLEIRYYGIIQDTLVKSLSAACDLVFIVKDNPQNQVSENIDAPLFEEKKVNQNEVIKRSQEVGLRPSYKFSSFAVSSSNQMAWAASEAVSKDLGYAYNPLFIWGGVGVGKTHLMHAIGHHAIENDLGIHIVCCTGEKFTNDIVEGIRNKTTSSFRTKYRKLKLLLVDDIQFIAGKDSVQEEFFHTFNDLVSAGSQIILTSDKPPSEISRLEDRLKSRFEAGLIVDIAPPDFELRCAITQIKAAERMMNIPADFVHIIAANLDSARKIEGFLVKLMSEVNIKKSAITNDLILNLLGKGNDDEERIKATPPDLIEAISKYYSIGKRNLLGDSRARTFARPRQILMYLLRIQLGLPLEEVGRVVGDRDHTTVMHAVDKITTLASQDVQIREDIKGIKNLL